MRCPECGGKMVKKREPMMFKMGRKGIAPLVVYGIIAAVSIVGVAVIGVWKPDIFPEPLRSFFLTLKVFIEILGVSWVLPELRGMFILIFLPMFIGILYIIIGIIRGGK